MAGNDIARFTAEMKRLQDAVKAPNTTKTLTSLGMAAKADAKLAVSGDLGDTSMSHWRRGKPIDIAARFEVEGDTVRVTPTPRSRGPWRVLEDGRRGGSAYDLIQVGRRRKDGTRRGRTRGRNSGATAAKHTWTEASDRILKGSQQRAQRMVMDDIRKALHL